MIPVSGVVESKSNNGKSIKVNGEWFGAFSPATLTFVNRGDEVSFTYAKDKTGQYNNIKGAVTVGKGNGLQSQTDQVKSDAPAPAPTHRPYKGGFPVPMDDHSRSIIRQNALTNARELFCWALDPNGEESNSDENAKRIINIARIFEDYTSGDYDLRAAKELLKEVGN